METHPGWPADGWETHGGMPASPTPCHPSQGRPRPVYSQPAPSVSLKSCGKQMHKRSAKCKKFIEGCHPWKVERKQRQEKASDHSAHQTSVKRKDAGSRIRPRAEDHDPWPPRELRSKGLPSEESSPGVNGQSLVPRSVLSLRTALQVRGFGFGAEGDPEVTNPQRLSCDWNPCSSTSYSFWSNI